MSGHSADRTENRQRLMEIVEVVRRNDLVKGMTPEKLCVVIEELGPMFIKLGQILSIHSDLLPPKYCEALSKLHSEVAPMPYEQIASIIENSYGQPLEEVFSSFDRSALGSASIAQVHAAKLRTGEQVVVKVQREGIHDVMSRDILLLKQACRLLKYTPVSGLVDFNQVLDEMWLVAQEEMNFQTEAANLERFHRLNEPVAFVTSPKLYREYTTTHVLVMEHVDGIPIDDHEALRSAGYDLSEIGTKLADNYVRQIMEDGFFHADPHPGNLRVRDGKIVWLDMGMMGSLSERERALIGKAIVGIARGDINVCRDAVLGLGKFNGKADKRKL
ncbi:MAG: ABC1 kinase family protein, partial [Faecousia sp.]